MVGPGEDAESGNAESRAPPERSQSPSVIQASKSPGINPLQLPAASGSGSEPFPGAPRTGQLPGAVDWGVIGRHLHLTAREIQVMRGIWHGRKYTAIASELGISRHTVDTHARHIKAKLGVSSLMEAIHRIYAVLFEEERARLREELKADLTAEDAESAEEGKGGQEVVR
jgi:DNA-binding CsgD family transcriptional regulator